jgi:hypothetical protein
MTLQFPIEKIFLEPETNFHVCGDKKYKKSRKYAVYLNSNSSSRQIPPVKRRLVF